MKILSRHDLKPEDSLWLDFEATYEQGAALEGELEPFFRVLEAYAGGWMPDVVEGKRRRKYSRAAVRKALEEKRSGLSTSIGLYRTKWPALDMTLDPYAPPFRPKLGISLALQPLSFFEEERCGQFVEMVRAWAACYPVAHAVAHSSADAELMSYPDFGRDQETWRRDGYDKVYELCWLNIFGPKLVETVGRERMLSTPAHRVEALPNGAVLLVLWPNAAHFAREEARVAQARAHVHLRPDLDFATLLATLRERSATLAPVEPRFFPELAPLLSRVVDQAPFHERGRRIAELNAWRPPEPEEWLPAEAALPSDVKNPASALEHYSYLAECLVALLHTPVPSVFEATPESLTDADFYFWREEFPRTRLREPIEAQAVPAIGAYLGEVLVRHLGGQWIPRRKLEETQVRVGSRAWLPFLRARRYMQSSQTLLDYSLTHLYLVAARHLA
jgi:hypothetical protein